MIDDYDHEAVTCEVMRECAHDTLLVGEPRYCCVCIGHDCKEASDERKRAGLPAVDEES